MEEQDVKAKLLYYCREKFYYCMLNTAKDGVSRFRGELSFNFYHAIALILCDSYQEGIRELNFLKTENDYKLSTIFALIQTHTLMGPNEKDAIINLESQVYDMKKTASYVDLFNAAFVFYTFKKQQQALEYIEKALEIEPLVPELLCLKGWIHLDLIKSTSKESKASDMFEKSLKDNRRNLDGSLGLAESLVTEKNYDEAMSVLNKAVVRFPSIDLPLIQKMKLHFAMQNWEQCLEIINRVTIMDTDNLEALQINILLLICVHAKYEEAANMMSKFCNQLEKLECKNCLVLLENARLFSRVCGKNELVLERTYRMIERALEHSLNNSEYLTELAYQCYLQGKYKDAIRLYKSASKMNENSLDSLTGMTLCEFLQNGSSGQIKQQVEFLVELQETNTATLLFLQAKTSDHSDSLIFLNDICQLQLDSVRNIPYGPNYLLKLNPDFLLTVAKELLSFTPQSPDLLTKDKHLQKPSPIIKKVEGVLKIIVKACPGLQEALYLLSKVQLLNGDAIKAKNTLEQILNNSDNTFSDGYLLMAQIQVYTEQYERAAQNLEIGLSHNFKVRENPLYHFIAGIIEKNRNKLDDAIKSFTNALNIADSETTGKISFADKASIYFELIDAHTKANQTHEVAKLLAKAVDEFHGSSEEAKIVLLRAEQAISQNDVQDAIDMLSKIGPNEVYYLQAKTMLSNVLLEHRKDAKAYLQCYQEMVDNDPGPKSYLLLGDAYLQILEIEKALDAYDKALQTNPKDPYLCSTMGKALVKTHYYGKAVSYYKDAIKLTDNPELKLQLADLYTKLQQFDKAEMVLSCEIDNENAKKIEDIFTLQYKTKLMVMLAGIHEITNNVSGAVKTLKSAKDNQNRIIKRLTVEEADISEDEMKTLKEICVKLSELATTMKDNEGAVSYYKDALSLFPNDSNILSDLARLYMTMNNLELCQQTCALLLKVDPNNERASLMMADIAFRKVDFDMASFHFTNLLGKQPTNWRALVRFIEVQRRTGELDEVPQYLQQAETSSGGTTKDAGFFYSTALYQWYCGNLNGALRNFNNARLDPEWGKLAICNMIEICLNPDDEMLGDPLFDCEDIEYRDSRSMALKTADRLLTDLKQKSNNSEEDNLKLRLLENFLLLATKDKSNIEQALEDFTTIASLDSFKEEIGPILGLAMSYTMLKQGQRAKNQLKRVAKTIWTFEDAEYLERCWLLLTDYYIQSAKYELASELLKRILQHNKASSKAYEFSGFIAEKEQIYKDAAHYYDSAWKFSGKTNPAVGYKLAFNFMKSKRYAEAIDICQQVLKSNPDYPRIRKDILDKSLNNLRT